MPFRRRIRRATAGKEGIKHADSFINNIGSGAAPTAFTLVETAAGARTEIHQDIKTGADTDNTCEVGDVVKYLNVHIQCAPRTAGLQDTGWLEYAICWKRESVANITITNVGTMTLGEIATNLYRNNCLWTGNFPINRNGANSIELIIKVPQKAQKLHIGEAFVLFCWYRSNDSTDTTTDNMRLIQSVNFKAYS